MTFSDETCASTLAYTLAIAFAQNVVEVWNVSHRSESTDMDIVFNETPEVEHTNSSTRNIDSAKPSLTWNFEKVVSVSCADTSLLYCFRFGPSKDIRRGLRAACGTVFNQILVWDVSRGIEENLCSRVKGSSESTSSKGVDVSGRGARLEKRPVEIRGRYDADVLFVADRCHCFQPSSIHLRGMSVLE